jgi:hypothetical protein
MISLKGFYPAAMPGFSFASERLARMALELPELQC